MRRLRALFHRNFESVHGGHVVFRQLFDFLEREPSIDPFVTFGPTSKWDSNNLWYDRPEKVLQEWNPEKADLLVLGGIDWEMIPPSIARSGKIPTIHVVTAHYFVEPGHFSYQYLQYPAVRVVLCSSIRSTLETNCCNGPIYSWTEAIDFDPSQLIPSEKKIDWLIVGYKNPDLAVRLTDRIKLNPAFDGMRIETVNENIPRRKYLELVADSKSVLLLPYEVEGYYRAAIEAMALRSIVVTPDSKGPRDHCKDLVNCFYPPYEEDGIYKAVCRAAEMSNTQRRMMMDNGVSTASRQTYEDSRRSFIAIVHETLHRWREPGFLC